MFLQIHTLVSYPASLLNRDDAGLAKRIPFGNAARLRVSSQCQKRHWRDALQQRLPDVPDGLRTRSFFTRTIAPRLVQEGLTPERARAAATALAEAVVKGGVEKDGEMTQPVLFGLREADYFVKLLMEVAKTPADDAAAAKAVSERLKSADERKNLAAMSKSAAGLTAALFGRFVTSDLLARVDAPVHVAHAFTVHPANTEMDYFTVVDDLSRDDETGAAHANQAELGAGLYYGYVAVDLPLLVSNITATDSGAWREQDASEPKRVLKELIQAITTCSPGAKLGSTAPYSRAEVMLLEAGTAQPRTLANAFLQAVVPDARQDLMQQASQRMGRYLQRIDGMYGNTAAHRALSTIHSAEGFEPLAAQPVETAVQELLNRAWS
jgi:CRISPR system Cascade subunit CasC